MDGWMDHSTSPRLLSLLFSSNFRFSGSRAPRICTKGEGSAFESGDGPRSRLSRVLTTRGTIERDKSSVRIGHFPFVCRTMERKIERRFRASAITRNDDSYLTKRRSTELPSPCPRSRNPNRVSTLFPSRSNYLLRRDVPT